VYLVDDAEELVIAESPGKVAKAGRVAKADAVVVNLEIIS